MISRQSTYLCPQKTHRFRLIFRTVRHLSDRTIKAPLLESRSIENTCYSHYSRYLCNSPDRMTPVTVNDKTSKLSNASPIRNKSYISYNDCISDNLLTTNGKSQHTEYEKCLDDLNSIIQLSTPLIKRDRAEILPLFIDQLSLSGIDVSDLGRLNIIHVSGTKGKGSTCAFVESILRTAGLKTGFYSSPHLVRINERIRIDGLPIDDISFSKHFRTIHDRLISKANAANIPMPGYFSFLTILAFHIFLDQKVEAAVVEVGVGGEYDPTNVVRHPIVCGISTLDYDHTTLLGRTLGEIAWSKAGIAKQGVPLYTVEQQSEAYEVIKRRCDEKNSPLYICEPISFSHNLQLGIKGAAQYTNAALACQLAKYFLEATNSNFKSLVGCSRESQSNVITDLSSLPPVFQKAISNCTWPGRCQIVKYPKISFFLDGAHTKKSMENCIEWYSTNSIDGHAEAEEILMVNIIGDRDRKPILSPLTTYKNFKTVLFSTNKAGGLSDNQVQRVIENIQNNVKVWHSLMNDDKPNPNVKMMLSTFVCLEYLIEVLRNNPDTKLNVLVTGSLRFVGSVLETLPSFEADLIKD